MIFTSFDPTKDFKCNFSANKASDPSNDSMIVLDYYDGTKDFIDIGSNNFEKVDFSVQIVDVGDDYKALTEYLRDNSGKSINVTDKGNVLGFEITNFDFFLYGLEEEGESQFNFKTLSFSGCFRPNTTQSGQQFLLEVEINAFSVDVITQTLPANGSFTGETYYEINTKYLWIWNGSAFDYLPTTKPYEVDYYVDTFLELPQYIYEEGVLAYVVSENQYYKSTPEVTRQIVYEFTAISPPTIQSWKVITLNDPTIGLKDGVVRFSSFYDYTDVDGNTYKSGFIAKKGVRVPKKKVKIQKGANVEILEGFKIKINNAERFSQDIVEFNFYGSTCNLKWFNGSSTYPIRTGINKTNTISESIYEFSVEPFLWRDNNKYIPHKTLPSGSNFVPQTYGDWDYAKLYTKNKSENVLEQEGFKSFFIVNDGYVLSGKVIVQIAFQENEYNTKNSFNNGDYKLKFPFSDELFSYESFTYTSVPTDTSPSGSFIFTMDTSSLLHTDILAGQLVSFVDLAFTLVIDDQECGGFLTNNGGGLEVYNYDSEKDEYIKINEGLFKVINDHTIGINNESFYTIDEDFNIKYLRSIKTEKSVNAGQLDNFIVYITNGVTTPFGNINQVSVKGIERLSNRWLQTTLLPLNNVNQIKGLNPNNASIYEVGKMILFHYGYFGNSGLMIKENNVYFPYWVQSEFGVYPKYERHSTQGRTRNYGSAKTTFVREIKYGTGFPTYWLYQNYNTRGRDTFYNVTPSDNKLASSITYTLDKKELEKLKGTKGVKIIGAFSFGMTSIYDESQDYWAFTNYFKFQHKVSIEIFLRDSSGTLPDALLFTDSTNTPTQLESECPPYVTTHSPLNNNYVFCNVPKSLGGSDKFYDGSMSTSNYTICRFQVSINWSNQNVYPLNFNIDWSVKEFGGGLGEKSVVGVQENSIIDGVYYAEILLLDVVPFTITKGNNYKLEKDNGNFQQITASIDEFHDEIKCGKDTISNLDAYFGEDMLINKYDNIVILAEYEKDGSVSMPNNQTHGFGTFSNATNLYTSYIREGFIDETNTDLDHNLYFSNEIESSLSGDGDGIFVKCEGRDDGEGRTLNSAFNILNDQIKQINTDKTLRTENLPSRYFTIREQIDSKKTFKDMLMQFAEDTHSMVVFDRDDNLVAKTIDLKDFPINLIKTFDQTNVVKNSTSKIKQSDFKDIATSVSMKYHYHTGKGKVDKVITAKLSTDRSELIVTGLDGDSNDSNDILARKKIAKTEIETLFESMSISNQYYNTGRENNVETTRERFFIIENTFSLFDLAKLFVKYAEYKIFNKWEMSFTASIEHFENIELGDVISFELDSINKGKPVFGFVSGIEPKFYEGKCIFTLTSNVDPFLYSRLYNNTWDSGIVDLEDYEVNDRKNTEVFKLPYKDPNNINTYPDSENVDDSGYNLNNNQFTDNTFADADGDISPIT
jgi:hypothetical protein